MSPSQTEVRSRIQLDLRSYQERVLSKHLQTILKSDRGRNRTFDFLRVVQVSKPLDHAIGRRVKCEFELS